MPAPVHATLQDPDAKKPDDWDERKMIPDPTDKKPEGYDDIPEKIVDPEAKQPEGESVCVCVGGVFCVWWLWCLCLAGVWL